MGRDEMKSFLESKGAKVSGSVSSSTHYLLSGEGGGSSGQMLNVELRWKFFEGFGLSAFHDWGQVTVNHDNGFAGAPALNRYSLQGHGLALAWQAPAGLNLRITWARRQGANPNPTANGSDQDGSLELNRFWLTASLPF